MKTRFGALARMLGLMLLVLAVSPVTLPFSTVDLVGLLSETAPAPGVSFNTKKAPDEPLPLPGNQSGIAIVLRLSRGVVLRSAHSICHVALFETPLRV